MLISKTLEYISSRINGLHVVGGACRDYLLGRSVGDYDLTGYAPPDCVRNKLKGCADIIDKGSCGSLKILMNGESYDYTPYRKDEYGVGHYPSRVYLVKNLETDCLRRDFTVNALYYSTENRAFADPTSGRADLNKKILRTVKNAEKVMSEDGERILRLIRFAAELGFAIDNDALRASGAYAFKVAELSQARIFTNLAAITADNFYRAAELLKYTGVFKCITGEDCAADYRGAKDEYLYNVFSHSKRKKSIDIGKLFKK